MKKIILFAALGVLPALALAEQINAITEIEGREALCYLKEATPDVEPKGRGSVITQDVVVGLKTAPTDYLIMVRKSAGLSAFLGKKATFMPLSSIKEIRFLSIGQNRERRYNIITRDGEIFEGNDNFNFLNICKNGIPGEENSQCVDMYTLSGNCADGQLVRLRFDSNFNGRNASSARELPMRLVFVSDAELTAAIAKDKADRLSAEAQRADRRRAERQQASTYMPTPGVGQPLTPRELIQQQASAFNARENEARDAEVSEAGFQYMKLVRKAAMAEFFGRCMKYGMATGNVRTVAYINRAGAATYAEALPKTRVADCPLELLNTVQFPSPPAQLASDPGFPVLIEFNVAR